MTFDEAKQYKPFWDDYYNNQDERIVWKDVALTPQQFFDVWSRKDEDVVLGETFPHMRDSME